MTPAGMCRAKSLRAGNVISVTPKNGHCQASIYCITAIARHRVLAIMKGNPYGSGYCAELLYDFTGDHVSVIGHMDPFADELVWP